MITRRLEGSNDSERVYNIYIYIYIYMFVGFFLNPGQPRTLLQLNLVGILTINLFLTYYTTSIIKTKIHPLNHLVF
jgi:hypothetical protein